MNPIIRKHSLFLIGSLLLGVFLLCAEEERLPDYLRIELKRLEETWNVLDQYAEKAWPGWKTYADVPFLFEYPNGLMMMVGHPSPMDGFELVSGIEIRGKKVYLDRSKQNPLELKPPLGGGGGPLRMGKEKVVETVWLRLTPISPQQEESQPKPEKETPEAKKVPEEYRTASENQILLNIHELFHCFQREVYRYRFGNLRYNTDAHFALYSEIEGLALEKAYLEKDEAEAKEFLKDFLAARQMKRASMTELEQNQESEDDLMEGTAVYAETMVLELAKKGYKPVLTKADDPYFLGFSQVDHLLQQKLDSLRSSRSVSMESRMKCYSYGCFQALLLTRFYPGWQETFFQEKKLLDQEVRERLNLSPEDIDKIAERLKTRYPFEEIKKRHEDVIRHRDEALEMILARKGRVYVVNFKPAGEYLSPKPHGKTYNVGLIHIFPEGIEKVEVRDVLFTGTKTPIIQDQLYYIKWVDTEAKPGEKGYTLTCSRKEGEDIYYDAEFKTGGFTLKAPKVQVKDLKSRIKVTILSKIKEPSSSSMGAQAH